MSGSSKEQILSIENVEFVKKDESKRRGNKKAKRSESDEQVLIAPPMSSTGRNIPLYDEEQGETNPLLGSSSGGANAVSDHQNGAPQQQPYPGQEYYVGYTDYGVYAHGHPPPSTPRPYPPMMNVPPNAMNQYYDQMGAPVFHPLDVAQQQVPSPQQMQQFASYIDMINLHPVMSPDDRPLHGRRSEQASPPLHQIRKSYPGNSPHGVQHPLKRPHQVRDAEYEIPLRDSIQEQTYGAIPDSMAPPRSSARPRSSRPPRRKSDTAPPGQRPPSPITRSHRRSSSDSKFGRHRHTISSDHYRKGETEPAGGKHRRSNSERLPPKGLGRVRRSVNPYAPNRRRTHSGSSLPLLGHVRAPSISEASLGASVATSTSMVSHVTDISKSAFFGGTTESGKVQLHFPFENVRLAVDNSLPTGVLYMRHVDEEQYEDYHIYNDEHIVPWDLDGELPCQCTCLKCIGCTERNQQLGPCHYIMTVNDDLYRRIFDEISASQSMPCGLFFFGHHEDVSQPSILIAGTVLFLVIFAMMVATILTNA